MLPLPLHSSHSTHPLHCFSRSTPDSTIFFEKKSIFPLSLPSGSKSRFCWFLIVSFEYLHVVGLATWQFLFFSLPGGTENGHLVLGLNAKLAETATDGVNYVLGGLVGQPVVTRQLDKLPGLLLLDFLASNNLGHLLLLLNDFNDLTVAHGVEFWADLDRVVEDIEQGLDIILGRGHEALGREDGATDTSLTLDIGGANFDSEALCHDVVI